MSSLKSSNPAVNSGRSFIRRKKKKIDHNAQIQTENLETSSPVQWKLEAQQQKYSSKLLQALQQVGAEPRRVREAAYGVLAATAKGRSRWSRAILRNRLKLKLMKKRSMAKRQMKVVAAGKRWQKKSKVSVLRVKSKCFERKARVLSRLIPGCRKQPLPVVLEEAMDFIPALQMQVRAMSALAELLSCSGSGSSSTQLSSVRSLQS